MSLLRRLRPAPEARHVTSDVSPLLADYRNARLGSLLDVDADVALRHSAVWACVRLIAGTVSTLPVDVIRVDGQGRRPAASTPPIVAAPSALVSPITWRDQLVTSLLLRGNAVGQVTEVDRAGYPTAIELIHPDRVMLRVEDGRTIASWDGADHDIWPLGDAYHLAAFTVPGSPFGLSVIDYARTTIGAGLAAEEWGGKFFTEGAVPSAVLSTDQAVTRDQAQEIKARFMAAVAGKREPAVLGAGVQYVPISVSPGESAFLDTAKFSGEAVCRIFGVQPEMVGLATAGATVTYANREQRVQDFLTFTLAPWVARLEESMSSLLPDGHVVKFRTGGLLRADIQTRFLVYEASARIGQMGDGRMPLTVDEMRELEDLAPMPESEDRLGPTDLAEVARRLYTSVGKVLSVDEAREIMRRGGLDLPSVDPQDIFDQTPPMAAMDQPLDTPTDPQP